MFAIRRAILWIRTLHKKASHRAFAGGSLIARSIRSVVWFGIDLRPRCKRELSSHDDCFTGFNATFNDHEIAILSLPGFDWTKIHGVVRLQDKNEWTTLTDLHRL